VEIITPEDMALLQRFEPIACFNVGEQFYPMEAERYIARARLCAYRPYAVDDTLVPRGQLSGRALAQLRYGAPDAIYYLNAVDPLSPAQVLAFRRNSTLRHFHAGQGRLARVGILARTADLLFSLTLLLRGKVPGGMAAAAALLYQETQQHDEAYCYYGRVVREHGYVVLQYWFFYAFNDWRSSFHGVNDHEGDWEMITVYVVEDVSGAVQPCWVAYTSHEFEGDDLRRRWDDPELERIGEHPVIYVAAGSHANYYRAGEYQPIAEIPQATRLLRIWQRIHRFWRVTLRQGGAIGAVPTLGFVRIPFVDYARGDGLRIGPGQEKPWQMRVLQDTPTEPAPPWVDGYRGLWGLYTGDPIAGEDAPPGPKYSRDGTVRKPWYNPLGWSGLDKVPPPGEEIVFLELQEKRLHDEQAHLQRQIADQLAVLLSLEMEAEAIYGLPHLQDRAEELREKLQALSEELDSLKARRATNAVVLEICATNTQQIAARQHRGPRDHLRLPQVAASSADLRLSRLAEVWGAVSIGLLLLSFFVITQFASAWEAGLLALLGVYVFIEALFRRQIQRLIGYVVVGLAILNAMVLVYEFFPQLVASLILLAGLFIIIENVRELHASLPPTNTSKKK
jgi:hypothetical protein